MAAALLGSEERLEYTLVGDTVNLSQRLQDLARPAGVTVCSEATIAALSDPVDADPMGPTTVKGREGVLCPSRDQGTQPMTSSDPILAIRGVRKTFEAELAPVRALRGVDLDVGRPASSSRSWARRAAASRRC